MNVDSNVGTLLSSNSIFSRDMEKKKSTPVKKGKSPAKKSQTPVKTPIRTQPARDGQKSFTECWKDTFGEPIRYIILLR